MNDRGSGCRILAINLSNALASEYNVTSDWLSSKICDSIFCDIPLIYLPPTNENFEYSYPLSNHLNV